MAYGKIKADSIIYDNSGSDVEKTIASLAADTEGTAIKSTGETGISKFLRVDGDNSCSWAIPPDTNTQLSTEQVQDIVGAMVTGNTETGIAVTYEDGDGTLDFVVGTLNQDTTGTAAVATEITATANNSTDETVYPTFVDGTTGAQGIETDSGLTYNPSTGLLTAVGLTLSGDLTVGGTTTTINSTTLTVDDKNIELGSVSSPSDTTADGGGITLKGASDKTFNWVDATDAWTSSEHIHLGDSKKLLLGTGTDCQLIHDGTDTFVQNKTGNLNIACNTGGDVGGDISIQAMNGEDSIKCIHDAQVELYHNNVKKIETTAAGVTVAGSVTDDKGDVRKIIQNTQGSTYTLVASDAGKHILASGTVTIPNSVFAAGDAVTIVNNTAGNLTLTASVGTLYNTADAATGNRTLAARGMATILFASATAAYISGAGLS